MEKKQSLCRSDSELQTIKRSIYDPIGESDDTATGKQDHPKTFLQGAMGSNDLGPYKWGMGDYEAKDRLRRHTHEPGALTFLKNEDF